MKVISDIRIYKSKIENIEGNSLPSEFKATKILNAKIKRIVMAFVKIIFHLEILIIYILISRSVMSTMRFPGQNER